MLVFLSTIVLAVLYPNGGDDIVSEKSSTMYVDGGVRVETVFTEKSGNRFTVWKIVDRNGRIIKYSNDEK